MHLDTGVVLAAVRVAFWLALVLLTSGETAVGGGWVGRAQRLLADVDGDVVERGYVLIHVMYRHIFAHDLAPALELAEQITEYGRRFADPDLLAMGLCAQGRIQIYCGRVPEGLALLDESMVGVTAGEVSTIFAGNVYCTMIEGCQEIADFDRAAPVDVRAHHLVPAAAGPRTVHRPVRRAPRPDHAHARRLREALTEFDLAMRRYRDADALPRPGWRWPNAATVLRLRGDLTGAAAAYDAAVTFGYEPQPGLALLWLAQGRTGAAVAAVHRLLGEAGDPVHRSRLLPARWKHCSPAASRTPPPRTRTSSDRSPRRSAVRRCRPAPTMPGPRWRSTPVTPRRHCHCCAASVTCGSGWARGTTPPAAAFCSDERCARPATRTPLSPSCPRLGGRWRTGRPARGAGGRHAHPAHAAARLTGVRWRSCDWSPPDEPTRRSRRCWCSARRR
jgi:hypothetical protein